MPIFEYKCADCEAVFEIMTLSSGRSKSVCPQCGSKKMSKLLSSFATYSASGGGAKPCDMGSCDMPQGPGGMPPCGAGGCGMM